MFSRTLFFLAYSLLHQGFVHGMEGSKAIDFDECKQIQRIEEHQIKFSKAVIRPRGEYKVGNNKWKKFKDSIWLCRLKQVETFTLPDHPECAFSYRKRLTRDNVYKDALLCYKKNEQGKFICQPAFLGLSIYLYKDVTCIVVNKDCTQALICYAINPYREPGEVKKPFCLWTLSNKETKSTLVGLQSNSSARSATFSSTEKDAWFALGNGTLVVYKNVCEKHNGEPNKVIDIEGESLSIASCGRQKYIACFFWKDSKSYINFICEDTGKIKKSIALNGVSLSSECRLREFNEDKIVFFLCEKDDSKSFCKKKRLIECDHSVNSLSAVAGMDIDLSFKQKQQVLNAMNGEQIQESKDEGLSKVLKVLKAKDDAQANNQNSNV